jgi:hypothetical protein
MDHQPFPFLISAAVAFFSYFFGGYGFFSYFFSPRPATHFPFFSIAGLVGGGGANTAFFSVFTDSGTGTAGFTS